MWQRVPLQIASSGAQLFLMSIGMSVTKGSKEGRSPVLLSEA
jgi:hypothetical protein